MTNNGDTGVCEVCGQPVNYYFGWRHDNGEGQRHKAWPSRGVYAPSWPVLTDDEQVILLATDRPVRLEAW